MPAMPPPTTVLRFNTLYKTHDWGARIHFSCYNEQVEPRFRERNKATYRLAHWPIWIFVFFIAPGPLTFDLFERGFDARMALWLGAVLVGPGIAGLRGALPGVEPKPYIIRFTEDRPNPLYRRVCYTFAW